MAESEFGLKGDIENGYSTICILEQSIDIDKGYARGPERALLAALLFDGVQSYMNYFWAESENVRARYREAFNWVNRKNDEYVFSFESTCDALGIDPEYLRLGLINACSSASTCKKSRRNF